MKTWVWEGHEFTLYTDYLQPSRGHTYLASLKIDADRAMSFVCTIDKNPHEISLDDMLDSLAKKAQRKARSGRGIGKSLAYILALRRARRIRLVDDESGNKPATAIETSGPKTDIS